ncbi:unnamed protein product [Sympodiomycopsis kandeliae]
MDPSKRSNRPGSGDWGDQGTLASSRSIQRRNWDNQNSSAQAYVDPYKKDNHYGSEGDPLYYPDRNESDSPHYQSSSRGRPAHSTAQQPRLQSQPMTNSSSDTAQVPAYPYGGSGVYHPDSPSQSYHKPQQPFPIYTGTGSRPVSPVGAYPPRKVVPQRKRRDSHDWNRLMKDAGYSTDGLQSAIHTHGVGSDSQVKGPLSWLRSVMQASLIVRWFIIIVPILALLWVPGIVAIVAYNARPANNFHNPQVWNTPIFYWSCWLSAVWMGWWICSAVAGLLPRLLKKSLGSVAVVAELGLRRMIDFVIGCDFYVAVFLQTILIYATWLTVIWKNFQSPVKNSLQTGVDPLSGSNSTSAATTGTTDAVSSLANNSTSGSGDSTADLFVTISRFWFGLILCSAVLLAEKLFIQAIAYSFHQDSFSDRLATSRFQVAVLATMFTNSSASLMRKDTQLEAESAGKKGRRSTFNPVAAAARGIRQTGSKVRNATKSTGTVLGNVAVELKDQKGLLQVTSPKFIVLSAFESTKETRKLARRIFYSFSHKDVDTGRSIITAQDLAPFFPDKTTADAAFGIFDRDCNGSMTREEMEAACLGMMHERMALVNSMHDVDSAVSSLDGCFMSVFVLIAAVIVAAMLSTKFSTLVTSLGSVLLGLSWLFSSSAAEAFASIIFVIGKHPYDTGDKVDIPGLGTSDSSTRYEVVTMNLLSTIFKDSEGKFVQVSNAALAQKAITNHRRSGPIEETLKLDIAYTTSLAQLEELRSKMMSWLKTQSRDFLPGLNISIATLGDQSKMQISTGIRYKSNWQDVGLKVRRRNRWICAFRAFMIELKIYGPSGDPDEVKVSRVAMIDPPAAAADPAPPARQGVDGQPPEYKLMDEKNTNDLTAEWMESNNPIGLTLRDGGNGGTSGLNTGMNTPVRAESPAPLSSRTATTLPGQVRPGQSAGTLPHVYQVGGQGPGRGAHDVGHHPALGRDGDDVGRMA